MPMETNIQFGELEESAPDMHLPPDRIEHYAVAGCGSPITADMPIYIDIDVMRDMEAHALSDTRVELGGVLLGGQYRDPDGRSFVVVSYSLRAQHYESTKGSFKFTHDTWTQITRQREELAEDLQMVGWYHTHPGWGVFLSGMDMFICDNFFNKPLDVALVIDPCRDDRGFFQWTAKPEERIRRTSGFYLMSSRFRQSEVEYYAAQLEGELAMPKDQLSARFPAPPGPYTPPVINIAEPHRRWQDVAVLAILTMQFMLLVLIAWRLLSPPSTGTTTAQSLAVADFEREAVQLQNERELLDHIWSHIDEAPNGLLAELKESRQNVERLKTTSSDLFKQIRQLREINQDSQKQQQELKATITNLRAEKDILRTRNLDQSEQIEKLQASLPQPEKKASETGEEETDDLAEEGSLAAGWDMTYFAVGAAIVFVVALGMTVILRRKKMGRRPEY